MTPVDAIVLAGGRITGEYAVRAGTSIKALAPVAGRPALAYVIEALRGALGVERVCVVGPEALRKAVPEDCAWLPETETALGNLLRGCEHLNPPAEARVLVCGSDVPVIHAEAVQDFLTRSPEEADLCMPVVRREAFMACFEGSRNLYVPLAEGAFTAGSQYLFRPEAALRNRPLLERLFNARKSQLGMARTLGAGFVFKLVTRRLTVAELERRAGQLTGCVCRAVMDCRAELAYDIDSLPELLYAEEWLVGRRP
jgi:molybdopterin-guanine dinucleotide biosynthesis protein A